MNTTKDFEDWGKLKETLHFQNRSLKIFDEREIWWCSIGQNIGFEENGKNRSYERPVLVLRRFNGHLFLGVPLTSKEHHNKFYFRISDSSFAILSQLRTFSSKRLLRRVKTIPDPIFDEIRRKLYHINLK